MPRPAPHFDPPCPLDERVVPSVCLLLTEFLQRRREMLRQREVLLRRARCYSYGRPDEFFYLRDLHRTVSGGPRPLAVPRTDIP